MFSTGIFDQTNLHAIILLFMIWGITSSQLLSIEKQQMPCELCENPGSHSIENLLWKSHDQILQMCMSLIYLFYVFLASFFPSFFVVCQKWKNKREIRLDFLSRVGAGSRNHLLFLMLSCMSVCDLSWIVPFVFVQSVWRMDSFSANTAESEKDFETK